MRMRMMEKLGYGLAFSGVMAIAVWRTWPASAVLGPRGPALAYFNWSYRHAGYSDVVSLYRYHLLWLHRLPYFHNNIEYPVLIGCYMAFMALLPGFWGYYWGSVLGLWLAGLAGGYCLWQGRGRTIAWQFALSPLIAVFGTLNWDLLGLVTWGLAVLAFRRRQWFWSGFWIGLGSSTKLFPLVLLPFCALWLWRQMEPRSALRLGLGTCSTVIAVNLPFLLGAEPGWGYFWNYNANRPPDPGFWSWLQHSVPLSVLQIDQLSLAAVLLGGVALLAMVRWRQMDPIEAATAALGWWLMANKVYSPQYILWFFYAALWVQTNPGWFVWFSLTGLLDFGLSMRWMALGSASRVEYLGFVHSVVPLVLVVRDVTLLAGILGMIQSHGFLPKIFKPAHNSLSRR